MNNSDPMSKTITINVTNALEPEELLPDEIIKIQPIASSSNSKKVVIVNSRKSINYFDELCEFDAAKYYDFQKDFKKDIE